MRKCEYEGCIYEVTTKQSSLCFTHRRRLKWMLGKKSQLDNRIEWMAKESWSPGEMADMLEKSVILVHRRLAALRAKGILQGWVDVFERW